jgi:hypothetical protein
MTQRATIEHRDGYMSSEFIEGMARRYFGNEVVDGLPRYVRGKRKGQLKGRLEWQKVTEGGWVNVYGAAGNGYVERRIGKVIKVELNLPEWGAEPTPVATWDWELGKERDAVKVKRH